jgi:secondary thiamine-phosphate synthase enzyme
MVTPKTEGTMGTFSDDVSVNTKGFGDVIDITPDVQEIVGRSGIKSGIACVAAPGSTAGITTIEFEDGAVRDLKEALERLAPMKQHYHHDARWGDGNGFAHVRSALLGASRSFPVKHGRLVLGTWQQVVLIDFDNRPRDRRIVVQVVGE